MTLLHLVFFPFWGAAECSCTRPLGYLVTRKRKWITLYKNYNKLLPYNILIFGSKKKKQNAKKHLKSLAKICWLWLKHLNLNIFESMFAKKIIGLFQDCWDISIPLKYFITILKVCLTVQVYNFFFFWGGGVNFARVVKTCICSAIGPRKGGQWKWYNLSAVLILYRRGEGGTLWWICTVCLSIWLNFWPAIYYMGEGEGGEGKGEGGRYF